MPINSANLIPELQNWPNYFVVDSIVNRYEVPFPTQLKTSSQTHHDNSFIRLLFDDNWDRTEYKYHYIELTDFREWPATARDRLMIYQGSKYYRLSEDTTSSINIFFLDEDLDLPMLDTLMAWRNDSTSVQIIDSTSIINPELVYDVSGLTSIINYNTLTSLGKLIYCLLDLEIYNNTEHLEERNLIATNVLEYFFELYINDILFKFLTADGWVHD